MTFIYNDHQNCLYLVLIYPSMFNNSQYWSMLSFKRPHVSKKELFIWACPVKFFQIAYIYRNQNMCVNIDFQCIDGVEIWKAKMIIIWIRLPPHSALVLTASSFCISFDWFLALHQALLVPHSWPASVLVSS